MSGPTFSVPKTILLSTRKVVVSKGMKANFLYILALEMPG